MKQFKVEVSRKVVQSAKIDIETTSSYKARAIAEYKANNSPIDFDWRAGSAMKGSRMKVDILETEDVK